MSQGPHLIVAASVLMLSTLGQAMAATSADAGAPRPIVLGEGAVPELLISEFYANALAEDEYVRIRSAATWDVQMCGWRLTDGEGTLEFVSAAVIGAGGEVSVSFNSSSYVAAYDVLPDFAVDASCQTGGLEASGSFRLGDSGDSISLVDPSGSEVDCVLYGDVAVGSCAWSGAPLPAPRDGEVFRRITVEGRAIDTDTVSDWQPFREFRYGYTDQMPRAFDIAPGGLSAFVSPDCSLDVVLERVGSARKEVVLCSYEFQSAELCLLLLDAMARGVSVRVLVEGSPVGGMSDAEVAALSVLESAGADVRVVAGTLREGVARHFAVLHSKYMVVDSEEALVLSENFVSDGIPIDRVFGNRGWGVAVNSPELACYLRRVFDCDSRSTRPDIVRWSDDERYDPLADAPAGEPTEHPRGCLPPFVSTSASRVVLYMSPDANVVAPFLCALMASARDISVELLHADLAWDTRWSVRDVMSPLLSTLLERMRDGASCRLLLDSSWYNAARNEEVTAAMTAAAYAESLTGSFRLISAGSPISVLHNKGVILDGDVALVSSNNWVYASFARNRELAAVIESSEVCGYFAAAFDMDWIPDTTPPTMELRPEFVASPGERVLLSPDTCQDDRTIACYRWDIGIDGEVDGRGPQMSYLALVPGSVPVSLTVVDAWGNSATAMAVIRVVGNGAPAVEDDIDWTDAARAAAPLAVGIGFLLIRMLGPRGSGRQA
ncbi:MAG: lamin tail domain-containing protein [Methanobacteriota archaeon]|nr:MAG: lamin tail domain-containing protein [Euryarchaeota archaeon]